MPTSFALLETLDMGKPIGFARSIDINAVAETVRWYAEAIDRSMTRSRRRRKTRWE